MWTNAQRDGRPAEYWWCPLFNAAKFGWRPLLERRAVTLPIRESRWNLQIILTTCFKSNSSIRDWPWNVWTYIWWNTFIVDERAAAMWAKHFLTRNICNCQKIHIFNVQFSHKIAIKSWNVVRQYAIKTPEMYLSAINVDTMPCRSWHRQL